MNHPLSIFLIREDHVSWDRYEQQIDLIEDLTEDEKRRAKIAIRYLRALLGEDFLRRACEEGNPIFSWFFVNSAPHARRSLIRLAEELQSFENAAGFKGLVERLKNHERAPEALTVLGAASSFSRAGFMVSFDPKVESIGKFPDLQLVDSENGEEIYTEVSRLRKGGHQELNSRTYHVIHNEVLNAVWSCSDPSDLSAPHVRPYVRIFKALGNKDLIEVVNKIRGLILAAATSEYLEWKFKDAIEMAVSPAHDHSQVRAWAAERGMRDMVEAPPIPLDGEIRKARDKIVKELEQLPEDRPGIIVIPSSENLLFFVYPPQQIIMEIAQELRQHPSLLCAVLSHSFVGGEQEPSVATLGQHALVTTMTNLSTDRTAIVMNESFGLILAASTIEKVRNAFLSI